MCISSSLLLIWWKKQFRPSSKLDHGVAAIPIDSFSSRVSDLPVGSDSSMISSVESFTSGAFSEDDKDDAITPITAIAMTMPIITPLFTFYY